MRTNELLRLAAQAAEARDAPVGCERLLTMLVDDEPKLLAVLADGLAALGHDVVGHTDAEAALERLRADDRVAVLLTDIMMPRMTGLELMREAMASRADASALEGIVITADGNVDSATSAMRSGGVDLLAKPFGLVEAATAVGRALKRAATRRGQAQTLAHQREALVATEASAA